VESQRKPFVHGVRTSASTNSPSIFAAGLAAVNSMPLLGCRCWGIWHSLPTALIERIRQIVIDTTENLPEGFCVSLKVNVRTGRTWADCQARGIKEHRRFSCHYHNVEAREQSG